MSRPTKITPDIQKDICDAIRAGNYMETAAAYAGINKSTLYAWLKRGKREIERVEANEKARTKKSELAFVEFSNAVKKAQADSEVRDVAIIGKAAETNWQAAAWRLERKNPKKWGRKDTNRLVGPDDGPVKVEHEIDVVNAILKTPEGIRAALELLASEETDEDSG